MKTLIKSTQLILISCTLLFSNQVFTKQSAISKLNNRHVATVEKMILTVQPTVKYATANKIARLLYNASLKYNVDPKIMVAIISTESDFDHTKVSTTGDLSLAQINVEVWNKEFKRLGMEAIDAKKLKLSEAYAVNKMGEILSILKKRHQKKDAQWYARYHSHTKKFKMAYSAKVEKRVRKIASIGTVRI